MRAAAIDIDAEVLEAVRRIFREELQRSDPVLPEHELAGDLQLDSVQLLTLVVGLENRFQIALAEEDAGEVRTVGDLARLVVQRRAEADR